MKPRRTGRDDKAREQETSGAGPDGHVASGRGMADNRFRAWAEWLIAHGIRPNHFTLLQVPVFAAMIWAGIEEMRWTFFWLSWLVIILDGGDGILARVGGLHSKAGARLDAAMDTFGVAVILWGAAWFFPAAWPAFAALFAANVLLYFQNDLLDQKMVSYVRGPVAIPIVVPDLVVVGLAVAWLTTLWLLVTRVPATWRRLTGKPPTPAVAG